MNIIQQRTDGLNGTITIELAPEDYKGVVNNGYKQYAKRANIPGFRPGTAPLSMIKRMAGKGIAIEEISKLLQESLNKYMEEEKVELLGEPLPAEQKDADYFDENGETPISFTFEVGFAPAFELDLQFPEPIVRYDLTIDDAFVDEQIARLTTRFGQTINPEEAAIGDFIYGKLTEVDTDGDDVAGGFSQMVSLNPEKITNEAAFKAVEGKKVEESVPFDIDFVSKDDDEVAKAFFLNVEDVPAIRVKRLSFTLKRINRSAPAEMNAEFFKQVLGEERAEGVETEAQLRESMKEDIKKQLEKETLWVYRYFVKKALMNRHSIELPEKFLRKWLIVSQEKINEENVDQELPPTLDGLRWQIITEAIIEQNPDIKVHQVDIENSVRQEIAEMFGGNGTLQMGDDRMEEYVKYALKQEDMVRKHISQILNERVYEVLEPKVVSTTEAITASAFAKLDIA